MTVYPRVVPASSVRGAKVRNPDGEDLGKIEDIMLDVGAARIAYAVLSFGGFLGLGDKLFAIPWEALALDPENEWFVLDIAKEQLEDAPGFDKDHWPDMGDRDWGAGIHSHYGHRPYWMI